MIEINFHQQKPQSEIDEYFNDPLRLVKHLFVPLKNYNINSQTTLLYKINIQLYNICNTTGTIPRGAKWL